MTKKEPFEELFIESVAKNRVLDEDLWGVTTHLKILPEVVSDRIRGYLKGGELVTTPGQLYYSVTEGSNPI